MEDRLSRVEKKIDSLQEAIISLARVEERLVTVFNRQSKIEAQVDSMEQKMDAMAESIATSMGTERIVWILIAAGIAAFFNFAG
jgi:vacuolar-type H+-ATPase subunit E/Vma4